MVSASFAYLSLFTFSNIFMAFYLQTTVTKYKKEGKLPSWALKTRIFLDNLDDTIKPADIEKISRSIVENLSKFNFVEKVQPEPMKFLQIKPTSLNTYDLRDDYEFKRSLREQSQSTSNEKTLNEQRLVESASFKDPRDINEQLNTVSDENYSPTVEEAEVLADEHATKEKNTDELNETIEEFNDHINKKSS